jgi:hypothetical protein
MKRFVIYTIFIFSTLIFSACNSVETPEGKVPLAYQDAARDKLGIYAGAFAGKKIGRIEVIMEGDHVRAQLIDPVFGEECQASLGLLKRVSGRELSPGRYSVSEAVFSFEPNLCREQIAARELKLVWDDAGVAGATYLSKNLRIRACENAVGRELAGAEALRENTDVCVPENIQEFVSAPLQKLAI